MNPSFQKRVSDRFDNNPLNVLARENDMKDMEMMKNASSILPNVDEMERAFENFIIRAPGMPVIFLYALACESVATLRSKTQGKTGRIMDPRDFLDMDYKDLSPVTRDLENELPVKVQHSMDGIPTGSNGKWFDYLKNHE